jgi:hypothetical protein
VYGRIIENIREFAPDLVLCVSLSGRNFPELEKRSEPLQLTGNLKPDMGSLTLSSVNFNKRQRQHPQMIQAWREDARRGIRRAGGLRSRHDQLREVPREEGPHPAALLFQPHPGQHRLRPGDPCTSGDARPPENSCGPWQASAMPVADELNGRRLRRGVRVGLEDNIWYDGRAHAARATPTWSGGCLRRRQRQVMAARCAMLNLQPAPQCGGRWLAHSPLA